MIEPPIPARGMDLLVWSKTVWRFIVATRPRVGPGLQLTETSHGTIISLAPVKGGSSSSPGNCSFGEIIALGTGKAIRGGVITAGDQNWNIDPNAIDLTSAGNWLVSIAVTVEVNRDDDNEILLPQIKTGTRPTGPWTLTPWPEGPDYPDNTAPTPATGSGTIILPIGKLTVTIPDGETTGTATFAPTGCGDFHLDHCAGTLLYSR